MAYNPSTLFEDSSLYKAWTPHRCQLAPYGPAANPGGEITMLQPGVRVDINHTIGGDAPNGNGGAWSGLAAAGWGYGGSDPECDLELAWENFYIGDWVTPGGERAGLVLCARREYRNFCTHRGAPFIGCFYVPAGGGNHAAVFAWFDPAAGAHGTLHTIGSVIVGQLTAMRVRLIKSSATDFEGQYDIGAGWVSLGSHTSAHAELIGDNVLFPAMMIRPRNATSHTKLDVTEFRQNSGAAVPDAITDNDDDFNDGIPPAIATSGAKWGDPTCDNGWAVVNPQVSESGGDLIIDRHCAGNEITSIRQVRTFYPGTDIDLEIEMELTTYPQDPWGGVTILVGLSAFGFTDGAHVPLGNYSGWHGVYAYLSRGTAFNIGWGQQGSVIQDYSPGVGVFPERHTFRLKRMGNLWTCTVDGGAIDLGNWSDDTTRDAALKLWIDQYCWMTNPAQVRVGSIVVNGGDTLLDTGPPIITFVSPGDGAVEVSKSAPVVLSFADDSGVNLQSILAYIRGGLVYNSVTGEFGAGWEGSSYVSSSSGYVFRLVPDIFNRWRDNEIVSVSASCEDIGGKPAVGRWHFGAAASPLGLSIYRMIVQGVRSRDERG